MVELYAGDLIFIKANHVADTLEFDKPLRSRTLYPTPPIYHTTSLEEEGMVCSREVEGDGLGTMTSVGKHQGQHFSPIPFPVPFQWTSPVISPVYDLPIA